MPRYEHTRLVEGVAHLNTAPQDAVEYGTWIESGAHLKLLRDNALEDELIVYAADGSTFVHGVVVPNDRLAQPDHGDLLRWSRSESEYWLTSLPGQAAVDGGQLFLLVDDAHSGRLCAWDVVPNRCGGHSTRSVSRVAHAHPGASRPQRNSLSRLWPVQIRDHSPLTLSSPRRRNWRKPRPALIWPKTGSTVAMRRA